MPGTATIRFYLAMDFIEGKDLLATWNRCAQRGVPFPIEVAVYIVKELARGLGYAHAFGGLKLVHRDVSPANVLLSYTRRGQADRLRPGDVDAEAAADRARDHLRQAGLSRARAGARASRSTGAPTFTRAVSCSGSCSPDSSCSRSSRRRSPCPTTPKCDSTPTRSSACATRARSAALARHRPRAGRAGSHRDAGAGRPTRADRYQTGEELRADLAPFLAKSAPETDAATLAKFLGCCSRTTPSDERARARGAGAQRARRHFLSGVGGAAHRTRG